MPVFVILQQGKEVIYMANRSELGMQDQANFSMAEQRQRTLAGYGEANTAVPTEESRVFAFKVGADNRIISTEQVPQVVLERGGDNPAQAVRQEMTENGELENGQDVVLVDVAGATEAGATGEQNVIFSAEPAGMVTSA
jgi:hypothetical protein